MSDLHETFTADGGVSTLDGHTSASSSIISSAAEPRKVPFVFTGKGGEYFNIWIVNILLSIVTLGIYSAWAKVRNKQYFYGNTSLDGASFIYTASPQKILAGRLIAMVFLVVFIVSEYISITLNLVMLLLFFLLFPWVVCKSLRFNARNSRYRNVPFDFRGTFWGGTKAFILWPIAGVLTVGGLMPYAYYKQRCFIYGNHAFGQSAFTFAPRIRSYYKIFAICLGIVVAGIGLAFLLGYLLNVVMVSLSMIGLYLALFAYFTTASTNLNYQNLGFHQHRFQADWGIGSYLWLVIINTLAILMTLGLFIPWAKVRTARYKAEHTWCMVDGSLDGVVAGEQEKVGALGEGVSDLFDVELGF